MHFQWECTFYQVTSNKRRQTSYAEPERTLALAAMPGPVLDQASTSPSTGLRPKTTHMVPVVELFCTFRSACKHLKAGDDITDWQQKGYDSAWAPAGTIEVRQENLHKESFSGHGHESRALQS